MRRAVFLDRDGVINEAIVQEGKPYPPRNITEFKLSEGAEEACRLLSKAGYELVVVTNQPDVSRGKTTKQVVESFHGKIESELGIKYFYICFHDDDDDCLCRKPKPGLIFEAATDLDLDLSTSYFVGDRWKDVEVGQSAGCKTIFVDHSYLEKKPDNPVFTVSSLLEAAHIILGDE